MKFGLVVYPETQNLGDDIQSYAAMQFLPRVDYYLDRERLNFFQSEDGEKVAAIMNGWYMKNKFNWPPSNNIVPHYISMHFNQEDYFGINTSYLDGIGGEVLREQGTVGCRDIETMRLLQEKDISSYFSGCLTLTLPRKFQVDVEAPYACLVNVSDKVFERVEKVRSDLKIHQLSQEPHQLQNLSWKERFRKVEEYLTLYQNATFVITTKLHCALPCLALGTPVLLLEDSALYDLRRFSGLDKFLHVSSTESFLEGKSAWDLTIPPPNSKDYLPYRRALIESCTEFVQKCEDNGGKVEISLEERMRWLEQLLTGAQNVVNEKFAELYRALSELQSGKDWLEKHSKEQEDWIGELQRRKDWLEEQNMEKEKYIEQLVKKVETLESKKRNGLFKRG